MLYLHWSIADLQICVSIGCTPKWFRRYIYIYPFLLILFPLRFYRILRISKHSRSLLMTCFIYTSVCVFILSGEFSNLCFVTDSHSFKPERCNYLHRSPRTFSFWRKSSLALRSVLAMNDFSNIQLFKIQPIYSSWVILFVLVYFQMAAPSMIFRWEWFKVHKMSLHGTTFLTNYPGKLRCKSNLNHLNFFHNMIKMIETPASKDFLQFRSSSSLLVKCLLFKDLNMSIFKNALKLVLQIFAVIMPFHSN